MSSCTWGTCSLIITVRGESSRRSPRWSSVTKWDDAEGRRQQWTAGWFQCTRWNREHKNQSRTKRVRNLLWLTALKYYKKQFWTSWMVKPPLNHHVWWLRLNLITICFREKKHPWSPKKVLLVATASNWLNDPYERPGIVCIGIVDIIYIYIYK